MWIAIECSVTVSMGEDRSGAFSEMRLVTGVSRETSDAGKPADVASQLARAAERVHAVGSVPLTNVPRQDQKVIVG